MKNKKILKKVVDTLLTGWTFLIISIGLMLYFPEIGRPAVVFTFFSALFFLILGIGLSISIKTDDLFWKSIEKVDKAHLEWINKTQEAIIYKTIYLNLILETHAISEKELEQLVKDEKDRIKILSN